jgi:hypothetical protein
MRKATLSFLLSLGQALLALLVGLSSFMLWLVFPRGYFPSRHLWVGIHKWSGLALGLLVLLHVVLHRGWLVRMGRRHPAYLRLPNREG